MNESPKKRENLNGTIEGQISAAFVLHSLEQKAREQAAAYATADMNAAQRMQDAANAFNNAVKEIEKIRDFVSPANLPHVLGSDSTKHGEIAEQVEVHVSDAFRIIRGLPPIADVDSIPRTGPVDYSIDGDPVQSKFYNSAINSFERGVEEHLNHYPKFLTDATEYGFPGKVGYYHIPKDQYDFLMNVKNGGTVEGMRGTTIEKIRNSIRAFEERTGMDFSEAVRPSISDYKDVQVNTVGKTLDGHEEKLREINKENIDSVQKKYDAEKSSASHITDASLSEALKATAFAAIISGVTSAGIKTYSKIKKKNGKKLSSFTADDWKEIGVDFAKGGTRGGITGAGIYGLTKLGGFPAPFAGAMMSGCVGLASLVIDYRHKKNISKSEFADAACALSVETGIVAVGSALGQTVIPIPVAGAIIGSIVIKSALDVTKFIMGEKDKELVAMMEKRYQETVAELNAEEQKILSKINAYYDKLGGLIMGAMNVDVNIRLNKSIELCQVLGVSEKEIIHNTKELDDFMLN